MNAPQHQAGSGRRFWRVAALSAAVGLIAACGGSDGDSPAAPAPAPVAADVAVLGDLAVPVDSTATASEALAALSGLLPPDGVSTPSADFPAELLPPT